MNIFNLFTITDDAIEHGFECFIDGDRILFTLADKENVLAWIKNYKKPFKYGFTEVFFDDSK